MEEEGKCCGCHQKSTPRKEQELKQLKNRLNRIVGQLNGIGKMLDENRYCGEKCTSVLWICDFKGTYGDLCSRRNPKREY